MLDLKELERKLDQSLKNETKDTLTQWLLSKREKNLDFLGIGVFEYLTSAHFSIESSSKVLKTEYESSKTNISVGENNYSLAA